MANYYGVGRTNYVRLKDEAAYQKFADLVVLLGGFIEYRNTPDGTKLVAAFGNEEDGGFASSVDVQTLVDNGYVSAHADSELNATKSEYLTDQDGLREVDDWLVIESDLLYEAYPLLAENEMLIFQTVGHEKMRYLSGYAQAIHSSGETVEVSLDDIYKMAQIAFNLKHKLDSVYY